MQGLTAGIATEVYIRKVFEQVMAHRDSDVAKRTRTGRNGQKSARDAAIEESAARIAARADQAGTDARPNVDRIEIQPAGPWSSKTDSVPGAAKANAELQTNMILQTLNLQPR